MNLIIEWKVVWAAQKLGIVWVHYKVTLSSVLDISTLRLTAKGLPLPSGHRHFWN